MNDLLAKALEAHGGLERWRAHQTGIARVTSGGELLDRKAPQTPEPRTMTVSLHEQFASVTPFGAPDRRTAVTADRVAIETVAGDLIGERLNPRDAFAGHDLDTPWDPYHRAYFNGYAMWSYLTAPFSFAMPGAEVEEIEPLRENGEEWRGISVVMPASVATHSHVQKFYFGTDYLLRRQDYTVDIAGGFKAANYCLDLISVDGFLIPSKRRAYLCDEDYRVLRDRLMIWIDFSEIHYR